MYNSRFLPRFHLTKVGSSSLGNLALIQTFEVASFIIVINGMLYEFYRSNVSFITYVITTTKYASISFAIWIDWMRVRRCDIDTLQSNIFF